MRYDILFSKPRQIVIPKGTFFFFVSFLFFHLLCILPQSHVSHLTSRIRAEHSKPEHDSILSRLPDSVDSCRRWSGRKEGREGGAFGTETGRMTQYATVPCAAVGLDPDPGVTFMAPLILIL